MTRRLILVALALALLSPLAACGKKPGSPAAPEGSDPQAFPRRYPSE